MKSKRRNNRAVREGREIKAVNRSNERTIKK